MDKYEVFLYPKAYRDIEEIYSYIESAKLEPSIAKGQTERIWEAIESLGNYPFSHQKRLEGRYADKGYRQLIIDNYIAIYRVDDDKKRVYVVTVQYAGRNL